MILCPAEKSDYDFIKKLYREAFPLYERMPFGFMLRKHEKGKLDFLVAKTDCGSNAIVIPTCYRDTVLINYFAVDSNSRGQGVGSKVLSLTSDRYKGKRLIVEIEKPDPKKSDTVRRKEFYLRNGFKDAGIDIILAGTPMEILAFGGGVSAEEYIDIYINSFGKMFAKLIVRVK